MSFERCSEPSGVTESTHCASRCGAAAHCCDVLCCASYDIVNSFFVISIPSGSWSDGPIGRFELSNFASPANDCVTCRKHVREIVTVVSWRQNTHTHTASEHTAVSWDEMGKTRNAQACRLSGKRQLEWPRRRRKNNSMTCVYDTVFENVRWIDLARNCEQLCAVC